MKAIVEAYKDTTNPKKIWGTGLHVAKQKYVTLKADDRSLYGKLVRFHPRNSLWAFLLRLSRHSQLAPCTETASF